MLEGMLAALLSNDLLSIFAVVVALVTALIGAASLWWSAVTTNKRWRLELGMNAYRSVVTFELLAERAVFANCDARQLQEHYFDTREAIDFHRWLLWGVWMDWGESFHRFAMAVTGAYEPFVRAKLQGDLTPHEIDNATRTEIDGARFDFLATTKTTGSLHRFARSVRERVGWWQPKPQYEPPSWSDGA